MKILQVLPELNVGGVETGVIDFAKYLKAEGHESVVVSNGGVLVEKLHEQGSRHYHLPVHKKSLFVMVRMIKKLRKIIRDEKVDIVHARSRVPGWIAYFATRQTSAAFITTCHGYYKNPFFSQVMGFSKLVIVPSKIIGRHMIEDFHVRPESIRCIPRSVDLDKFKHIKRQKRKDAQFTVSIVGRLTQLKGHRYFLQAMAKVARSLPYIKVQIIGDASPKKEAYKQELRLLVKRLGLSEQVEFLGNRSDVPELLAQTDVLVLSTVTQESFGRVILEAQAARVPVVATNVGGVVDIIDDQETGLLVYPKDTEAMANAVLRLENNRSLREKIVHAAEKKLKEKFLLKHMASQTVEVYEELLNKQNILVIKLSSVGDVVLITAALRAIRKRFPDARITCLVGKDSRKILQNCPYCDDFIIYDKLENHRGLFGLWRLMRKLHKLNLDKVIDFQNNQKSHVMAYLSNARETYGFKNKKWGGLLTHAIVDDVKDLPPVKHQFQVLSMLGITYSDNQQLQLWLSRNDKDYARQLLDSEWLGNAKRIVGMNLSASQKWASKNWPVAHYAKLCDMCAAKNIRVLITGMPKDMVLVQQLLAQSKSKPANFVGKTDIMQLAALISHCQAFVTPDSAPLHIAAAIQVPVVVFFGPTHSVRHLPPTKQRTVFERKLSCSPCYSPRCLIATHDCMNQITPEQVFEQICFYVGDNR